VWIILIVALAVIALDQLSKYLVVTQLPVGGAWSPLPGTPPVFQIVHTVNSGVAFGLLKGLGPLVIGVALVVAAGILFYGRQLRHDQWLAALALGLMLGGATGNVLDRLTRQGQVIDFLDVGVGATRWYTSNVADVSMVLGVILLGLTILLDEHKQRRRSRTISGDSGQSDPAREQKIAR
jgi:signal peptidase II